MYLADRDNDHCYHCAFVNLQSIYHKTMFDFCLISNSRRLRLEKGFVTFDTFLCFESIMLLNCI